MCHIFGFWPLSFCFLSACSLITTGWAFIQPLCGPAVPVPLLYRAESVGHQIEGSDIATDFLDDWKRDLGHMPGAWQIFYPFQLHRAVGFSPHPDLRPCLLFCDISGRVSGPMHADSPSGAFILDASEPQIVDNGKDLINSRRCIMLLLSGKSFSNLRLVLAGRIYFSKRPIVRGMKDLLQLHGAMFIGQAFLEDYENPTASEALHRFRRKAGVSDREGNEMDPILWKFQPVDKPGSPFRWLHGTDEWRLLGPFTAYRVLGSKSPMPTESHIFNANDQSQIYNIVDPFQLNCTNYTSPENIHMETKRVLDELFLKDNQHLAELNLKEPAYRQQLEDEMVQLAQEGPGFYKQLFV